MQGSGIWVRAWVFVRVKGSGPVLDLECFRTASGSKLQVKVQGMGAVFRTLEAPSSSPFLRENGRWASRPPLGAWNLLCCCGLETVFLLLGEWPHL